MKKFIFSLEKVLSFKAQTLETKKAELAQLQHQLMVLEKSIEEFKQRYADTNAAMVEKMKEGMLPADISLTKLFLAQLDQQIRLLLRNRQQLLEIIAMKQREVLAVRTDISGLERLREKQWGAYRAAEQKEQELAIEEFVSHKAKL